jgi:hypothetical protein
MGYGLLTTYYLQYHHTDNSFYDDDSLLYQLGGLSEYTEKGVVFMQEIVMDER